MGCEHNVEVPCSIFCDWDHPAVFFKKIQQERVELGWLFSVVQMGTINTPELLKALFFDCTWQCCGPSLVVLFYFLFAFLQWHFKVTAFLRIFYDLNVVFSCLPGLFICHTWFRSLGDRALHCFVCLIVLVWSMRCCGTICDALWLSYLLLHLLVDCVIVLSSTTNLKWLS